MINSVLIANRGEIAVRIIQACRKLGLRAIAVYSEADRHAPHVRLADDALPIGAAPARDSYLDIDRIIRAAHKSGADAIHPGYGFLSENAAFARACRDKGLTFIGPPADVIELMGSKHRAREAASGCGVNIVPGYHGDEQDDAALSEAAGRIGYPLMIKASAGGGGRGMRRVYQADNFASALTLARDEALAAFGDGTALLERLVEDARHVEVQILADNHGNVLHLFDRDCSVQRNHQKLIEEAPAPDLPREVRQGMFDQSLALAHAIGYTNAGTVEFIYQPQSGEFFFLEMNTRLQVEHGVTEMVTGLDIVSWQIRIAGGEALPFTQPDIKCNGHAMQARICAEDPASHFTPATGSIIACDWPVDPAIRIDSGIERNSVIGHHYDSMLAKIISTAHNRDTARKCLVKALGDTRLAGPVTNIAFLKQLLEQAAFVEGRLSTELIGECYPDGWSALSITPRQIGEVALAAMLQARKRGQCPDPWQSLGAWRITAECGRPGYSHYHVMVGQCVQQVAISIRDLKVLVRVDEEPVIDGLLSTGAATGLVYLDNGHRHEVDVIFLADDAWHPAHPHEKLRILAAEQVLLQCRSEATDGGNQVRAPMPGSIAEMHVEPGSTVKKGDTLFMLEAMKLYQAINAPIDCTVSVLYYRAGDSVENGAVVLEIESLNPTTD